MDGKKAQPFAGFPKDLPDFLWGLALNNEKPWFEAHREQYERCLHGPMKALAWAVLEGLEEKSPGAAPALHLSRIYRDARRLRGRGPFNDHMWFSLGRTGQLYDPMPKFWFGIEARCYTYGMGMWSASGEMLERWRQSIDADPKKLSRIIRKINKMHGVVRYGETYKRPKGDPGPLLYDWYNARELGVERTVWFEPDPPGPELAGFLVEEFAKLLPLYTCFAQLQG